MTSDGSPTDRLAPLRAALGDFDPRAARAALETLAGEARIRLCHPLGDLQGGAALYEQAYAPLHAAWPDLERRDWILMAGRDQDGADWIGAGGYYCGTFARPWLDIPPSGHFTTMRFHEFYRCDGDRVTEIQTIWDIPEVMMQAGAWPFAPSLGREGLIPGPATQDGLRSHRSDPAESDAARAHVIDMLTHMSRHPAEGGPEVMEMERFWHPKMTWYGPAGIGTARGINGFRNWHQIPFLSAMPDRGQHPEKTHHHFFADGPYVAVTGWPNMAQTLSGPGWLGLAPTHTAVTLRSLDFWRLETGRIRENWVLVDLLDLYHQIGTDPLARMREFNKARAGFDPDTGRALTKGEAA